MKQLHFKNLIKATGSFCLLAFGLGQAQAQGVAVTDFEDASKSSYAEEVKVVNGLSWYFNSVNIGNHADGDMKFGTKAARFRHVDTLVPTLQLEDALNDITNVSFYYSRADFSNDRTGVAPTFVVAVGDGSSWFSLDTIDLDGIDELTYASYDDIPSGNPYFKIYSISGDNGRRFNIDSIALTYDGTASTTLALIYKEPYGSGVSPTVNELSAKFSDEIQKGTGFVHLYKTGGVLVESFDVTSEAVTIEDSTATISGVLLENATSYYVNLDAGTFARASDASSTNNAVTSSFDWAFSTADTTTLPPLTSLDETFTECTGSSSLGAFVQYSIEGTKTWLCSTFGRTDESAVYINGGSAEGVSATNNDYLITKAKLDFSAMENPSLSFWHAKRFVGDATLKVKISFNYSGVGNPEDGSVTWIDLHTTAEPAGDNVWSQVEGINLSEHKDVPFYLAFVYACGESGTFEYKLDDIKVEDLTSVQDAIDFNKNLMVLGEPSRNQINLRLTATTSGTYHLNVYDINGKVVHTQAVQAHQGNNNINISNISLNSGMYMIRMQHADNAQISTVKAVVK